MLHILLDSSPLGLLANPNSNADVLAIERWSRACITAGHQLYIPEIIDYELRRELLRADKPNSILKLNGLKNAMNYLPITTDTMLCAADLWASSRRSGLSTSDPKKLDIDVILCAQALLLPFPPPTVVVATSNVSHITRFVSAELWTNIKP